MKRHHLTIFLLLVVGLGGYLLVKPFILLEKAQKLKTKAEALAFSQ